MKTFSRERTENDFLQKVTVETIQTYIRPFIESRHKEILAILRQTKTPFFLRENLRERHLRASKAIEILAVPSKMTFRFCYLETFTYSALVQNSDTVTDLFGKFFAPLCAKPVQAVIGNKLHFFEKIDEKKLRPFFVKKQIEVPLRNVPEYIRKFMCCNV